MMAKWPDWWRDPSAGLGEGEHAEGVLEPVANLVPSQSDRRERSLAG